MNQAPTIQPMKRSIWDYLFYASMAVILIWLVLKMTGIIQTPPWLEYGVPIGSFVIGFIMLFQSLNDRFMAMQMQISTLYSNDARMEEQLKHIDKDVEVLKARNL
jgi:hypothetical protein